jgi:hypothetical protein
VKSLKPKTKWGTVLFVLFCLAIIITLIALFLTIYSLQTWPYVIEQDPSTNQLFVDHGYYVGGLIYLASKYGYYLISLGVLLSIVKITAKHTSAFYAFVGIITAALIDGLIFSYFANTLLDMSQDALVLYYLSLDNIIGLDKIFKLEWLRPLVFSMNMPFFLVVAIPSVLMRLFKDPRLKENSDLLIDNNSSN